MSERGKRIVALMQELDNMPEYQLFLQLRGFDVSIYIFHKNYIALNTILTFLASDERADFLFTVRHRRKLDQIGRDVVCYLHNYVASAMSLVDHTRRLYNKLYAPTQSFPDYEEHKNKEFVNNQLAQFVIGLRQYCQHYESPHLSIQTTYPNGFNARPVRKVQLALSNLLDFDGWKKLAKEYLSTVEEAVDIHDVVTAYRNKVMSFYQWFQSRQDEIHEEEFKKYRDKERELLLLQLEDNLDSYFAFSKLHGMTTLDIFVHYLPSDEFELLEQSSLSPEEQAQLTIKLLENHLPLSENLKEQIFRVYKEL